MYKLFLWKTSDSRRKSVWVGKCWPTSHPTFPIYFIILKHRLGKCSMIYIWEGKKLMIWFSDKYWQWNYLLVNIRISPKGRRPKKNRIFHDNVQNSFDTYPPYLIMTYYIYDIVVFLGTYLPSCKLWHMTTLNRSKYSQFHAQTLSIT